jgi:RNA polymerase sigma-70 factor (ECF subfamily)
MLFIRSKSIKKFTDEELVERYVNSRTSEYVAELFNRYTVMVYGVCMKYLKDEDDSKDATMQIFEKLISDLPKHSIRTFRPWLHMVTRNHCLMKLRKESQVINISTDDFVLESEDFVENGTGAHHISEAHEKEEKYVKLEQAVEGLTEEQRKCIELFYYQKKCYDEIADITGFSYKQVKSYIQNGKRNLRISLTNTNG